MCLQDSDMCRHYSIIALEVGGYLSGMFVSDLEPEQSYRKVSFDDSE